MLSNEQCNLTSTHVHIPLSLWKAFETEQINGFDLKLAVLVDTNPLAVVAGEIDSAYLVHKLNCEPRDVRKSLDKLESKGLI